MKIGLLWFDNDPRRPLEEKIARAAKRYRERFGQEPNLCYVNATLLNRGRVRSSGIRILGVSNIPLHHFWVGVDDGRKEKKRAATKPKAASRRVKRARRRR